MRVKSACLHPRPLLNKICSWNTLTRQLSTAISGASENVEEAGFYGAIAKQIRFLNIAPEVVSLRAAQVSSRGLRASDEFWEHLRPRVKRFLRLYCLDSLNCLRACSFQGNRNIAQGRCLMVGESSGYVLQCCDLGTKNNFVILELHNHVSL